MIPHDTAAAELAVVNTWGFEMATTTTAAQNVIAALKAFYDSWNTYRAGPWQWESTQIKFYNLSEPKPRVPFHEANMGLIVNATANSLPSECAICLSFQGHKESGQNQRRRRGRVYLGPFGTVANTSSTGRPDNTFIALLRTSADALLDASNAAVGGWQWSVISEATGVPLPVKVGEGWVDDAWDTQRRRGLPPTTRLVFTDAT